MIPLAHSPRGCVPPQYYNEHIQNVRREAIFNAQSATAYYAGDAKAFTEIVEAGAVYHDLGKLDEANQLVLRRESRDRLPIAHEDAGTAALLKLRRNESAVLVAAHHAGLFSRAQENGKQGKPFRNIHVFDHVNEHLDFYLDSHRAAGCPTFDPTAGGPLNRCGFTRRLALSCVVDADHSDTARHYGNEVPSDRSDPKWRERLEALDRYVASLPHGNTDREQQRNELRRRVYDACRSAAIESPLRSCDAPVGSGKTTAVMAYMLRVAQAKRLRHIFVVFLSCYRTRT